MEELRGLVDAAKGTTGVVDQCIAFLVFAGAISTAGFALRYGQFLWRQFLRPAKSLKQYGKWAIVTGATDGIGREYCNYLAEQGLNICLVSRTESKLKESAAAVAAAYSVDTKIYVADLVGAGRTDPQAVWAGLAALVGPLDVGVLVNNAGMSYDHYEYLDAVDPDAIDSIIAINATSLTKMIQVVLPGMKARKRGCVINISSGVSAFLPACPLLSVYAASKAYVDTLSVSLAAEYRASGIDVQVQPPYFVATKMSKIRYASLTVPSPKAWVQAAMRHVGYEDSACVFPVHAVITGITSLVPDWLITSQWLKMGKQARAKALKKKAAKAKGQ